MPFPTFFDAAPVLRMHDGLSELLGATPDGIIEYRYADAVRLAGHSCPTVAGAWLCARAGLHALYADEVPERGGVAVGLQAREDAGVTGVIGQVLTLVTGAAGVGGFKGLAGRHARNDLLRYGDAGTEHLRMQRLDTQAVVEIALDMSSVPVDPSQRGLLTLILQDQADPVQRREFGRVWQERVRQVLIDHADDPRVVRVRRVA